MEFSGVSENCKKEWYILRTVSLLIFAAITAAVILADFSEYPALKILVLIPLCMLDVYMIIYAYVFPTLQFNRYRYKIDGDRIEMKFGVIFLRHQIVPFVRMQHIVVYRGILDRLFNMSTVILFTAGSSVRLRNLGTSQALEVTERLKTLLKEREAAGDTGND